MFRKYAGLVLAGACAGAVNGLFGAGGGMILVPLLGLLAQMEDREIFPSAITIILPVCLVTLSVMAIADSLPWREALPYLLGSTIGGTAAGIWGRKIPTVWLHRGLGILILWGGLRYLW